MAEKKVTFISYDPYAISNFLEEVIAKLWEIFLNMDKMYEKFNPVKKITRASLKDQNVERTLLIDKLIAELDQKSDELANKVGEIVTAFCTFHYTRIDLYTELHLKTYKEFVENGVQYMENKSKEVKDCIDEVVLLFKPELEELAKSTGQAKAKVESHSSGTQTNPMQ